MPERTQCDPLLHEKRGITFQELGALIGVRYMLACGLLKHNPSAVNGREHSFNMNVAMRELGCGTVGCIGGNMAYLMGKDATYVYAYDSPLNKLFWPHTNGWRGMYWNITAEEAITAIDNFLNFGDPKWGEICRARVDEQ